MDSAKNLKTAGKVPLKTPEGTPGNPVKRMAVLFTDIVGSSKYFQAYGDLAGRRMLKEHERVATPPILEHGGVVVKMLGDSLMAYFFHPWEAVKAAIKIQKRLQDLNRGKGTQEHIRVRIGVHYGEGILEEKDIFGDVVNMAAKFLPFINGDEIGISHAVLEHIQEISALGFEDVDIPEQGNLPKGFLLYRVKWAAGVDLEPLMKALVLFRPLFALGKSNFRSAWERLLIERGRILKVGVEKDEVLQDQSLAAIVKDPSDSLSAAKDVLHYLQLNLGTESQLYLPLQIIIDIGPFLRGDKMELDGLRVQWEDIEPGKVYASAPAYHIIKNRGACQAILPKSADATRPFYLILTGPGSKPEECLFLYQNAMIQGDLAPCFYCGDRRHYPSQCPSKEMPHPTNAIGEIGYLPLESVNKLFFSCLKDNGFGSDPNHPSSLAFHSFYELKSLYQLRFFRTLWNSREEDWNKVMEGKCEKEHGGIVWIAQDCIRVSNLDQAESILKESLTKEPGDYKTLCALGFLHVEKNDLSKAKFYFRKGLNRCRTMPQKILLLFLLARCCRLQGDSIRAEEMIRRILRYHPHCAEAMYEDILIQFHQGREAVAVHLLMKLIKKNREYYVNAVIDPELARQREIIHPKIKALLDATREEANQIVERSRDQLTDLKKWLGDNERETVEAEALLAKMEELSKVDSFFSHMDILHYGANLVGICNSTFEERRRGISRTIRELAERHETCARYVRSFPYRFLVASFSLDLGRLHARISTEWGGSEPEARGKFKDMLQETERISKELFGLESRLQKLETLRRLLVFLSRVMKKMLILQSANLVVAIILFPIVIYYVNLILPGLNMGSHDIWLYQKSVLSLGSVSGLLLALFTSGSYPAPQKILLR